MSVSAFVGSYTQQSDEGVPDFLKAIGVPEERITQFAGAKLSVKIAQDANEEITVTRTIGSVERVYKFKLGEKYSQVNLLGESVDAITTLEDGKLVDVSQSGKLAGRKASFEKVGDDLKMSICLGTAHTSLVLKKD